jgi:hypothetical protein
MFRRWLIRSFCIALLVACVVAWAGSYLRYVSEYEETDISHHTYARRIYVCDGKVGFFRDYDLDPNPFSRPWKEPSSESDTTFWKDWDRKGTYHIIGFSFYHDVSQWFITFPIWFPTALSALFLWFAWRKTKPKYNGGAFLIEPTAKADEMPTKSEQS